MWFLPLGACGGSAPDEPGPGSPPLIPVAAPAPPPAAPLGPLPKLGVRDRVAVEWASDEVGSGLVAIACGNREDGAAPCDPSACKPGVPCADVWGVSVAKLDPPTHEKKIAIEAHQGRLVLDKGAQCTWLRVQPLDNAVRGAAPARTARPVIDMPAALAAAPPNRAWSVDLDGDGTDEVLYEKAAAGATNTIGVVTADGQNVVVWQDEAAQASGAGEEEVGGAGSTGTWSSILGLTDATLDGTLEIVVDLDRHDAFGFGVVSYAATGGVMLGEASCKPGGAAAIAPVP